MKGLRMSSVEIPDTNDKSSASPSPCPSPVSIRVCFLILCSCSPDLHDVSLPILRFSMQQKRKYIRRASDETATFTDFTDQTKYFSPAFCICMMTSEISCRHTRRVEHRRILSPGIGEENQPLQET